MQYEALHTQTFMVPARLPLNVLSSAWGHLSPCLGLENWTPGSCDGDLKRS